MKQLLTICLALFASLSSTAQQERPVIYQPYNPMTTYDVYQEHGLQGNRSYENNSHFYNQHNLILQNQTLTGNGQYWDPGNSNPVNRELYDGEAPRSIIILNGPFRMEKSRTGNIRREQGSLRD